MMGARRGLLATVVALSLALPTAAQEPPPDVEPPTEVAPPEDFEAPEDSAPSSSISLADRADMYRTNLQILQGEAALNLEEKLGEQIEERITVLDPFFYALFFGSFLILLAPLWLRRRYPGQDKRLLGYAAMAAITCALSVALFFTLMGTLRVSLMSMSTFINPKYLMILYGYESLIENVQFLAMLGDAFEVIQEQVQSGAYEHVLVATMHVVAQVLPDAMAFADMARTFDWLGDVIGLLPFFLIILVFFGWLVGMKDLLVSVARLPAQAAAGTAQVKALYARLGTTLLKDFVATVISIVLLFGVVLGVSFVLSSMMKPAMDNVVGMVMLDLAQFGNDPTTSGAIVHVSVGCMLAVVGIAMVLILLSNALFLGKTIAIIRARLVDGVPFGRQAGYWKRLALSAAWLVAFPVLFIFLTDWATATLAPVLVDQQTGDFSTFLYVVSPSVLALFLILYFLLRGFRATRTLITFKVTKKLETPLNEAPGQPMPVPAS